MNAVFLRFPEVYRCAMSEAKPGRLITAGATSVLAGACLLAASSGTAAGGAADMGQALVQYAYWGQALVLLVYGTSRATASVMTERLERTWDLQRLTPLSAWDLTAGKLLGAPLFAFFLAACLAPWALAGMLLSSTLNVPQALGNYAVLACAVVLALSVGLLVSAYSDTQLGGASSGTAGALLGLCAVSFLAAAVDGSNRHLKHVEFFGAVFPRAIFWAASLLAFGLWALAAAKWRIGRELMEGGRWWRLPAFLGFLLVYQLGFLGKDIHAAAILPWMMVYFAAVLTPAPLDLWRKWLAEPGLQGRLDRAPVWLQGAAALAASALLLFCLGPRAGGGAEERLPFLLVLFLIRDLSFLQWCRFTSSRRPEVMALTFIGLAYILPGLVAAALKAGEIVYWFSPAPRAALSLGANLLPALAQAGLSAYVLYLAAREKLKD